MKGTITLIALLATIATTSNAQSQYASQDRDAIQKNIAQAAPNIPALVKATGNGQVWHGEKCNYTMESKANIQAWVKNHPKEAQDFATSAGNYLRNTNVAKLSAKDAEAYYELKAKWAMTVQTPGINNSGYKAPAAKQ